MIISLGFISGFMVGMEFIWGEAVVFDLGIFRLMVHYGLDEDDPGPPNNPT